MWGSGRGAGVLFGRDPAVGWNLGLSCHILTGLAIEDGGQKRNLKTSEELWLFNRALRDLEVKITLYITQEIMTADVLRMDFRPKGVFELPANKMNCPLLCTYHSPDSMI